MWECGPVAERSSNRLPPAPPPTEKHLTKRRKPPKADRDLWVFERQAFGLGYATVAGVDEAGRGPWAGPVVAGGGRQGPPLFLGGGARPPLLTAAGGGPPFNTHPVRAGTRGGWHVQAAGALTGGGLRAA